MSDTLLEVKDVSKTFPGVHALSHVDFALGRGEIHGLMGENGAGKSTLIKIITGVYPRDDGKVILDGKEIHPRSPMHAEELGISTVYQEVNLLTNLSVAENLAIGRQPGKNGFIDWKTMNGRAAEILKKFDMDIDVTELLGSYSIAVQQMVAIARALELDSKLLILDEPTSSLNLDEVSKLFTQMRRLKQEGHSILFVTHFLDQVFEITDKITVLRNGEYVGEYVTSRLTKLDLISRLMGKALEDLKSFESDSGNVRDRNSEPLIRVDDFSKYNYMNSFSMEIRKGDVVGLAGLLGSGRTEVAKMLFGLAKPERGSLRIKNNPAKIKNPRQALFNQLALCPEDRKKEGLIAGLSVKENIVLALQVKKGWLKNLNTKKQEALADKYIKLLGIKTPDGSQLVENLSGGNQQKVIVARWLATDPDLLIVDEPTRGIDVGAKAEIQKLIINLSKKGMGVLFISSEIEEVVRCSNRIYVLQEKSIIDELVEGDIDEQNIIRVIAAKGE